MPVLTTNNTQDRLYAIKQKNAKHSSVGKTTEKNRLHRAKKKGVDVSTMKRHTNWQHWVYWLKIERAQVRLFAIFHVQVLT